MQLKDYLTKNKIGVSEMSDDLGLSQSVCSMWANNQRIPTKKNMLRLFLYTDGAVTPLDFYFTGDASLLVKTKHRICSNGDVYLLYLRKQADLV